MFPGIHLHEKLVPLINEIKCEVELPVPHQVFIEIVPKPLCRERVTPPPDPSPEWRYAMVRRTGAGAPEVRYPAEIRFTILA